MKATRVDLAVAAAIVVLGATAYAGIADNGFYKDDYRWMTAARYEMTPGNLLGYQVVGFFRPFTNLVFFVSERLAPASSAAYNLTNLIIHLINSVLCYGLLRVLIRSRFVPAAAAMLFAVAYTHSGAVTWVSARTSLIMTTFTLLALVFVVRGRGWRHLAPALVAYALALATKETAVAGLGLVVVVLAYRGTLRRDGVPVVAGFSALTVIYLVARTLVLGPRVETAWAIGPHGLTNLMGAVLYSYYPWDLTRWVGSAAVLRGSSMALWPEVVSIAVVAVLAIVARRTGRMRAMALALAWMGVALLPCSFFGFRFLNELSHVHNRYYYLAGVGVALSLALLVSAVWENTGRAWVGRLVAAGLLAIMIASNVDAVRGLEAYWGYSNQRFGSLVDNIVEQLDKHMAEPTVVLHGLAGWQPSLTSAVQYGHRSRPVIYEAGGDDAVVTHAPCLLVRLERDPSGSVTFGMFHVE